MTKFLIALTLSCSLLFAEGQNNHYVPFLDNSVTFLENRQSERQSEYLWYPGQLSAHLQQLRMKESQKRCVNVGYPGNFYKPLSTSYFKKNLNVSRETKVSWKSTGSVELFLNDKKINQQGHAFFLPKGKNTLLFKVSSENDLPAISVTLNNEISVEGWQASLDGQKWNFAETSSVFGTNGRTPLDDPEILADISPASILPIRNAVVNDGVIQIGKNGHVLIDFFHLEVGNLYFDVKGSGRITAFVGETAEEALNEDTKLFEQHPIEQIMVTADSKTVSLPERALRYVKLLVTDGCEISNLKFRAKIWPVEMQMSFECNDQRKNDIWNASIATLLTSMHGFYLDGVKRDYLPWSMDAVISTFAGDYLFGDEQVSRNSLSVALLPLNPQISDLGIPDYPLHAIIGFKQHYKRFGDFNVILSYRDRMEQLLHFYENIQDERGFISANVGVSWGFVPGWSTRRGPDRKGTPAYAQIMLYYNFKIGAEFAAKWGDRKAATHYNRKAEILKRNIMAHFWNEELGMFINGYKKDGELDKVVSHHAQYWAVLADIFPDSHIEAMFPKLREIPWYKAYVSYEKGYEFLAYSKAHKVSEMWDFLHEVFGDWLAQGHTRFPENFLYRGSKNDQMVFYSRPFGLSICHGANGAPAVVAVLNGIAGFSQCDKKLNHYTLQPDLMDLEWANIEFPVKEGKIKLKLRNDRNDEIEIPKGCTVEYIRNGSRKIIKQ